MGGRLSGLPTAASPRTGQFLLIDLVPEDRLLRCLMGSWGQGKPSGEQWTPSALSGLLGSSGHSMWVGYLRGVQSTPKSDGNHAGDSGCDSLSPRLWKQAEHGERARVGHPGKRVSCWGDSSSYKYYASPLPVLPKREGKNKSPNRKHLVKCKLALWRGQITGARDTQVSQRRCKKMSVVVTEPSEAPHYHRPTARTTLTHS